MTSAQLYDLAVHAIDVAWNEDQIGESERAAVLAWLSAAAEALRFHTQGHHDREILEHVTGERDALMKYIDDAKRAAGDERVTGEPLADLITRMREDLREERGK